MNRKMNTTLDSVLHGYESSVTLVMIEHAAEQ
jgi:hypothetical protein